MEKVYDWNKADLFHRGAENSRRDAQQALQEYAHLIKWRLDGKDSMLDAGCGPGNITRDVILPFLPGTFERLVGVDISNEMINYARATQIHPKLSFELFNLDMELEKQPLNNIKPFDHIFSCYCMMYVKDHNLCLRNFYKLLKPGGDTLLLLLTYTPIYDLYKQQSEDSRWSKYMHDVDNSKVPYQNSKNAEDEFRTILVNAGFTECDVKLHKKGFVFNSDAMHNLIHSINPFVDRMPNDVKKSYLDDMMSRFAQQCIVFGDYEKYPAACRFNMPYKLLVAYARKPI